MCVFMYDWHQQKVLICQFLAIIVLFFIIQISTMNENFDDDYKICEILVSYKSDDEDDKPKEEKPSAQKRKQEEQHNISDSIAFDIRQTIDFTKQQVRPRFPTFHENNNASRISTNSDWNDDTSSYEPSSNRSSFWDDTSDFHVQTNFSKIKKAETEKIEEIEQEKEQLKIKVKPSKEKEQSNNQQSENEMMVLIGKSMYTSKQMSTIKVPKNPPNISPQKGINIQQQFQQSENENQMMGIEESVYLSSQPVMKKVKGVEFKKMDNHCFWKFQEKTVEISFNLIQSLTEQFLKSETLIPLIEEDQYNSEHSELLIRRFTQCLNLLLEKQFAKIFPNLKQSKNTNLQEQTTYMKYIKDLPFLKKPNYSKVQIMKGYIVEKISSLKLMKQHFESFGEDGKYTIKQIKDELKICEKNVGDLQLLISFEKAEKYCETKEGNNIEQKVWKGYHQRLKEIRKRWIDSQKMIIDI